MPDVAEQLNTALTGRYALGRELGRGGMATVFLAEDLKHHRPVAIKVLDPALSAAIGAERFLREIEVTARLNHPHILPLHESGAANGLLYYVMPYVEGESLRERLVRERQLPLADALRIAREVADALEYAHRGGLVHRDVKPENILLAQQHAVVADFGIARAIVAAGGDRITTTGLVVGTPAYMSPEQLGASTSLDGRSDLYSLGCVLYEMLAGQPPFTGATAESLAHQHLSVAARPVTELRPAVPQEVEGAIERTLAKAAADRFSTASEFAAALAAIGEPAGTRPRAASGALRVVEKPAWHRARAFALAGAVAVVALIALAAWHRWGPFSGWLGGPSTAYPAKKDWILVAEFDGPPDDPTLAMATRDLVTAALDQSEIVATVPPDQIRLALEMAGKPTNTRVDAEIARELAYRRAVRTVVEGKIARLGQGYSVVIRVVNAESLKVVLTESAIAKNADALIPTLDRLVEKLRAGLGERRSAIHATQPLRDAATPSFEAYRLHAQAMRFYPIPNRIPMLRDALAMDPDFALAWRDLGLALGALGQLDSALAAYDEALRRPERLTMVQRLGVDGVRAWTSGDLRASLTAYDRALQYDPANVWALAGGALVLADLGRFREALERTRTARRASPFLGNQVILNNEVSYLSALGRVDEARDVARYIQEPLGAVRRTYVEIAANNWAAAESIAVSVLADPGLDEEQRAEALLQLASAQAARGALRAATATFARAEVVALDVAEPISYQDPARRGRLMLTIVSGGATPIPADTWAHDSSTATQLTRGLRAAIAGDRAGAQRLRNAARAGSRRELVWQGATPALLGARIEALAGRWEETARMLQPIASQPVEIGTVRYPAGLSAVRWFLADAFEQLGQPDSAAVYLERVVSDPAPANQESQLRGITLPFTHRRLVLLYARMGRIEDAKRHWQIFTATVRTPDPELRPLIAEARAALASAEGMAKTAEE